MLSFSAPPAIGSWLATSSTAEYPTAIGIVSAEVRRLPKPQTVLGVGLEQTGDQVRVTRVLAGSAAAKAGIMRGDIIVSIGEKAVGTPRSVSTTIRQMLPGDAVDLIVERGQRSLNISGVLGEAELATAAKGESAYNEAVKQLVRLVTWFKDRPKDQRKSHHRQPPTMPMPAKI